MKMRAATSAIRPEAAAQPDGIGPWPSYRAFRRVACKKADPAKTTIVPAVKRLTKPEVYAIIFLIAGSNLGATARDRRKEAEWMALGRVSHNLGRE
jgi:hypothetical protein